MGHKSLNSCTIGHQFKQVRRSRVCAGVVRNSAAKRDSCTFIDVIKHMFQYLSSHVVKVDIDAVRAVFCEFCIDIIGGMIDNSVIP